VAITLLTYNFPEERAARPSIDPAARGWKVWISRKASQLPETDYQTCLVLYQVFLVGMIACCVGAILSSTVFVMEINSKAQPLGFGDAKDWAPMANSTSSNICNIFNASSGVYTEQPLGQECKEHNTVDNHIRRLMCVAPLYSSVLRAPTNFTWAAFFFFSATITCYIAAKFDTWLLGVFSLACVALVINAAVIYHYAIGQMYKEYPGCKL
jgi:hypothetical protein